MARESRNLQRRRRGIAVALWLLGMASAPGAAMAHPHIYVDTGIEVVFDVEGRAEAVRITWVYDEFYSLVLVEERGLDADHDGNADAAERAALSGFDMNWQPGFAGDTYVLSGGREIALGSAQDWTADYRDGRLSSVHLRRLTAPVDLADPLMVQVYDPGFYTAYTIAFPPEMTGLPAGCTAQVYGPDRDAADEELLAALAEYGADQDVEADFPAIGAAFSEEVRVTCGEGF